MSVILIEKLRKSREETVEVNGHAFTLRRPGELAIAQHNQAFRLGKESRLDLVKRSVVGWDLKESDLINGGTPDPVEFHSDLFVEWVDDSSEYWNPLTEKLLTMINSFYEKRGTAQKN